MEEKTETKKRTCVFIDAENIRNSVREYLYEDIDYTKLIAWFNKKNPNGIYLYAGIELGDNEKRKKYEALGTTGYKVFLKDVVSYKQKPWKLPTTCPFCQRKFIRETYNKDKKKANCDADLTVDIISQAYRNNFDEAIIMSGDGDFESVYLHLVNVLNKKVIVLATHDIHTNRRIKELGKSGKIQFINLVQFLETYGTKMTIIL